MEIFKNIYLIGLGAVGASYGARLLESGLKGFRVIAGGGRRKRYEEEGIFVNGKRCCFSYLSPEDNAPAGDLIIVACKYYHLDDVIGIIKKFTGDKTVVISFLNGINSEEIIGSRLGMEKMLYALCLGIDAVRAGNDIKYKNIGRIIFGEKMNKSLSPRVAAAKELFDSAGIPCEIPEDTMKALWRKFMINAGINQISAVIGTDYGDFQRDENARSLMADVMREVIMLSKRAGINLDEADIDMFMELLRGFVPEGKTSMLQDIEARRMTEVEMLAGVAIELGMKYNVPTPLNDILYKMIKAMQNKR